MHWLSIQHASDIRWCSTPISDIRHVTTCYVHISMWSTGKVLENANIFFIYIAHANTYLVVCM